MVDLRRGDRVTLSLGPVVPLWSIGLVLALWTFPAAVAFLTSFARFLAIPHVVCLTTVVTLCIRRNLLPCRIFSWIWHHRIPCLLSSGILFLPGEVTRVYNSLHLILDLLAINGAMEKVFSFNLSQLRCVVWKSVKAEACCDGLRQPLHLRHGVIV